MQKRAGIVIAIDGVSGSGKSTLAKGLAARLGFVYLDTGAMYRAVTWKVLTDGIGVHDESRVVAAARRLSLTVAPGDAGMKVFVDGADVSEEIRRPYVSDNVSVVAAYGGVRERMVGLQREIAADHNIVLEGRDVGTVVFPNADLKFFIDASVDERAKRRLAELQAKGIATSLEDVRKNIEERDRIDSGRQVSPLRKAPDALAIDSTGMTIDEKTDKALAIARERLRL